MRLSEGELSDSERAEWERWRVSSPERDRAWARAQLLQSKLGGLPPSLAMSALDRPGNPERRAALGKLAMIAGPAAGRLGQLEARGIPAMVGRLPHRRWPATRTDPGRRFAHHPEHRHRHRRAVRRPSTPDPPARRRNPGADRAGQSPRPGRSWSAPRQGRMQALGTRFTVREHATTHSPCRAGRRCAGWNWPTIASACAVDHQCRATHRLFIASLRPAAPPPTAPSAPGPKAC